MLRLFITVLIYLFLGWLLCDIDPDKYYTWYSGIWHGLFVIPNFLRHLFYGALMKANDGTLAYNIFYWIFAIGSVFSFLFGGTRRS